MKLSSNNKIGVQARASVWFAMCSILQKGVSFITIPIFTRLLTTEQYGTYSLYLSWLQILTIITSLYLYYGVFNNGMTKFEEDRDTYISSMQGLTLTITAGVFVIYLAAYKKWSELLGMMPVLVALMFVEMAVTPALSFWSGRQRFELQYKKLVAVTLAKTVANPILGFVMVLLAQDKATARIASVVIIEVVFCGVIMIQQFAKGKCFFHLKYWKYALGLAIPLLPHYLSSMILNQGDRVMIDRMVGKSEVAFFSVAYSVGMLVQVFTNAINNSFTPWMYQKIKENNLHSIKETTNLLLIVVGVISAGLMMLSPELMLLFGSKEYASGAYVIPPVAASVFFIFLYNILAIPQFYYERTKFLALSSVLAAIVNVLLNFVAIRAFGYVAAGYTTLICYVLYSVGHYCVSKRVLRELLDGQSMCDSKVVAIISLIVILLGVCCNFLFDLWYVRYGLIVLFCIVAFVKREELVALAKGMLKKK
jgi:O-antigen/teichoic acid export membrane protein